MTYSNHDSRQRFTAIKREVEAVPDDPNTGTGWRIENFIENESHASNGTRLGTGGRRRDDE